MASVQFCPTPAKPRRTYSRKRRGVLLADRQGDRRESGRPGTCQDRHHQRSADSRDLCRRIPKKLDDPGTARGCLPWPGHDQAGADDPAVMARQLGLLKEWADQLSPPDGGDLGSGLCCGCVSVVGVSGG